VFRQPRQFFVEDARQFAPTHLGKRVADLRPVELRHDHGAASGAGSGA
jgi:hypothetical protein